MEPNDYLSMPGVNTSAEWIDKVTLGSTYRNSEETETENMTKEMRSFLALWKKPCICAILAYYVTSKIPDSEESYVGVRDSLGIPERTFRLETSVSWSPQQHPLSLLRDCMPGSSQLCQECRWLRGYICLLNTPAPGWGGELHQYQHSRRRTGLATPVPPSSW
uniref:Uncharacterized protein n=1 Tax=Branchiostoma floridae TaxID=7739 RepID=C3ZGA5_BRAFL|eukprot:XP_002592415.1 hypothetical protein BRAFLDRAFT_67281 [Branchiostoma floridae]